MLTSRQQVTAWEATRKFHPVCLGDHSETRIHSFKHRRMRNGITHSHILETEGEGWGATVRGHHQLLGETQVCPRLQLRFQNTVTFLGSESFLMKEQLSFNKESKASLWGKYSPSEELGQVKSER